MDCDKPVEEGQARSRSQATQLRQPQSSSLGLVSIPSFISRSACGPHQWSASSSLIAPAPSVFYPLFLLGPYGPHGPYEILLLNIKAGRERTKRACGPCGFHADHPILAVFHADHPFHASFSCLRKRMPANIRLRVPPVRGRIVWTWPGKAERSLPEN